MNRLPSAIVAAVVLFAHGIPASAQVPLTPRALGMGDAYLSVARGQESLWTNPANLALRGNPTWSLTLGHIAVGATTVGPTFRDFLDVVVRDDEDDDKFQSLLESVPSSGMEASWGAHVPLVSLQIGNVAIGLSASGVARQTIDRDILELLVDGYEEGRHDYSAGNTAGSHAGYTALSIAYGRDLGALSVGVTGRYLRGRVLSRYELSGFRFNQTGDALQVDLHETSSDGARGYSLDLGAALEPAPGLTLGAVVGNALGNLRWGNSYVREITLTENDFDGGWESIRDRFNDARRPADPGEIRGDHDATLPTSLTVGGAFAAGTGSQIAASLRTTLRGGDFDGPWTTSAGIGLQQKVLFFGLRGGLASNLNGGTLVSGGLSLGPAELGIGRISDGAVGEHANGLIATIGFQARGRIAW